MTKEIYTKDLIDVDKWNTAKWGGMAFFMNMPDAPPCLGIHFTNKDAGKEIFQEWCNRLSKTDNYEELRISIIEGNIPGMNPGYSVIISSEPLNTIKRASGEGIKLTLDDFGSPVMTNCRHHRMLQPNSENLSSFKKDFYKYKAYILILVTDKPGGKLDFDFDTCIVKKEIHLLNISELKKGDLELDVISSISSPN